MSQIEVFAQLTLTGIAVGAIYALVALGIVLIYKATETVSFAQGELMMLGAFGGLAGMTMLGFPYWLSVLCAISAMAVFGMLSSALTLGEPLSLWHAIGLALLVAGIRLGSAPVRLGPGA